MERQQALETAVRLTRQLARRRGITNKNRQLALGYLIYLLLKNGTLSPSEIENGRQVKRDLDLDIHSIDDIREGP